MTATLAAPAADTSAFRPVPLSLLSESPLNPRKHYDQAALQELARSIEKSGLITPILVRPNHGRYEIAAGHRRYRAAKLAELTEVNCLVREMDDETFIEVLNVENLQRVDIHPLDEADGYHQLLKLPGYDVGVIAAKLGKSTSYVYSRLELTKLIPAARKALESDTISLGHALILARLQAAAQKEVLQEVGNAWNHLNTVAAFQRFVRERIAKELSRAPWKLADAQLLPEAGACNACPKRSSLTPDLFGGGVKDATQDRCLDHACFDLKTNAHIGALKAEAAASGVTLVPISTNWQPEKGSGAELSLQSRYQEVKAKTKGAKAAVIVDGDRKGTVVHIAMPAKSELRQKVDDGQEKWKAQQRRADAKARIEAERRRRIFLAIHEETPAQLGPSDIHDLVVAFIDEMHQDNNARLLAVFKINRTKGKQPSHDLKAYAANLSGSDLTRFLKMLPVVKGLSTHAYDRRLSQDIVVVAKRHGVDVSAIDRTIKAEAKAKESKKGKPAKKRAGDVARAKQKAKR